MTTCLGTADEPKSREKVIALLVAGARVVGGGITLTSVSVANAAAEDAVRICAASLETGASATRGAAISLKMSETALVAVDLSNALWRN